MKSFNSNKMIYLSYKDLFDYVYKTFKDNSPQFNSALATCLLALFDIQKGNTDKEHLLETSPFNKGYIYICKGDIKINGH